MVSTFNIPDQTHHDFKKACVINNVSMSEMVTEFMRRYSKETIKNEPKPKK